MENIKLSKLDFDECARYLGYKGIKPDNNILDIVLCEDLNILEDKGSDKIYYEFKYEIDEIKLPMKKDSIVGKIKVYNGKFIKSSNLCINRDVNKLSFFDLYVRNLISIFSGNL